MPRLTKEPWFGPKKYVGWGWAPASWQGWLATALMVGLVLAMVWRFRAPGGFAAAAVVVVLFLALAWLTGTPPGGPGL
jgi:hypothetical protein